MVALEVKGVQFDRMGALMVTRFTTERVNTCRVLGGRADGFALCFRMKTLRVRALVSHNEVRPFQRRP